MLFTFKNAARVQFIVSVLVALFVVVSGCDLSSGGDSQKSSVKDAAVGTWAMHRGGTTSGAIAVYLHLRPDSTLLISNNPNGTQPRMTGTWSVDASGNIIAPFSNPPTGNGRIEAVLAEDQQSMSIRFIEFWHTPNKIVPYAGTRVQNGLVPHLR